MAVGQETVSDREAEVLGALGEHLTNAEIAQRLHISIRTVESHVSSLLRKLGAEDRRALATLATAGVEPTLVAAPAFSPLPTAWTTFVGRTGELDDVRAAVAGHRLVTLLGPGGIGKTRLAVAAADPLVPSLGGRVAFVDLVPVAETGVVPAIAAAVGAVERSQTPLEVVIHERLRVGPALVVLDNCEHVLRAAASWTEASLRACADLVVLATSRERLRVSGEWVVAVPPLGDEAVELFVERAVADGAELDGDPAAVDEICRRLDGVPLAIELAAARVASLGLDGLLTGLDDHLRLLGQGGSAQGATDRHRSLRAVIEWSHDLLDDEERTLFRRLAVFAGPFDLPAAAAVAADGDLATATDVVGRLADKSLLTRGRAGGASRWRMLEAVRTWAREQLEASGELAATETAHLQWAAATAGELEAGLDDTSGWVDGFDAVADDLRSAFLRDPGDDLVPSWFSLGVALGHLSYARGRRDEPRAHYEAAAERAPDPSAAVVAWRGAAAVALADQRYRLSVEFLERVAAAAEEAGDRNAQAAALAHIGRIHGRFPGGVNVPIDHEAVVAIVDRARSLDPGDDPAVRTAITLAAAWNATPRPVEADPETAREALAMARELRDPVMTSEALDAVAAADSYAGRHKQAARLTNERLELVHRMPRHDPAFGQERFDVFHMATEDALFAGDLRGALAAARSAESDGVLAAVPYLAASRLVLSLALLGEFDEAMVQAGVMRESWGQAGRPRIGWMAGATFLTAMVHGLRGDRAGFDEWFQRAVDLRSESTVLRIGGFVGMRVALHGGRLDDLPFTEGPDDQVPDGFDAFATAVEAEAAVVGDAAGAADQVEAAREVVAENDFAEAMLRRAAGRLQADPSELEGAASTFEAIGARFERACTLCLLPDRRTQGEAELAELGCEPPAG
jgi:predicted ATPase/DNA-binding CsgD family transcriptional regulator